MSTSAARQYNFVDDKNAAIPPTASRVDAELDNVITKLNQKVIISSSTPSGPIAGMLWLDSTNKVLKQYRNSEWVLMGPVHYGTTAPTTMQFGDLWVDSSGSEAILKVRNKASDAWLEVPSVATPAQGDVIYRGASAWANLPAGTAGQTLTTGGAAADPAFAGMTTQGDVEYHNGTTRTRLAPGTAGKFLKTGGAGANPSWDTPQFGAWATGFSTNTSYLAATDLTVTAVGNFNSGTKGAAFMEGLTDAANPPTTRRAYMENTTSGYYGCITFPVRKGDYWKVTYTNMANESIQTLAMGI